MKHLYCTLVRSNGSATPSTLRTIDSIHNTGIRIATGTYRTSSVVSLLCEIGEPSRYHKRKILSLRFSAYMLAFLILSVFFCFCLVQLYAIHRVLNYVRSELNSPCVIFTNLPSALKDAFLLQLTHSSRVFRLLFTNCGG